MGERGPAPKPTALKVLKGVRPARINQAEPKARAGKPTPPDWLETEARRFWPALEREVCAMKVATAADVDAMALYCQQLHRLLQARADIEEHGLTFEDDKGSRRPNPNLLVEARCWASLERLGGKFGLNPSARSAIVTAAGKLTEEQELEALMS